MSGALSGESCPRLPRKKTDSIRHWDHADTEPAMALGASGVSIMVRILVGVRQELAADRLGHRQRRVNHSRVKREFLNYRNGHRMTTSHEVDLRFWLPGAAEPGGYSAAATVLHGDEMHTLTNTGAADQITRAPRRSRRATRSWRQGSGKNGLSVV